MCQWGGFEVHRVVVWNKDETTGNSMFSRPPKEAGFESLESWVWSKNFSLSPSKLNCQISHLSLLWIHWAFCFKHSLNVITEQILPDVAAGSALPCPLCAPGDDGKQQAITTTISQSFKRKGAGVQNHDRPEKWTNSHEVCTSWLLVKYKQKPERCSGVRTRPSDTWKWWL